MSKHKHKYAVIAKVEGNNVYLIGEGEWTADRTIASLFDTWNEADTERLVNDGDGLMIVMDVSEFRAK